MLQTRLTRDNVRPSCTDRDFRFAILGVGNDPARKKADKVNPHMKYIAPGKSKGFWSMKICCRKKELRTSSHHRSPWWDLGPLKVHRSLRSTRYDRALIKKGHFIKIISVSTSFLKLFHISDVRRFGPAFFSHIYIYIYILCPFLFSYFPMIWYW